MMAVLMPTTYEKIYRQILKVYLCECAFLINRISRLQQNNMSHQTSHPQATYSQTHHAKNNRLYQHLLTSNYLHDHIYHHATEYHHPASIKFAHINNNKYPLPFEPTEKEDKNIQASKNNNLFKSFESIAKTSHQATQSLGSNYSIIEMENQSYSTLNLYSLSRNHIEPDLSLSSNNITQKLNHDDTVQVKEESKQSDLLLEGSTHRQAPTLQEVSCLQAEERMKKYKSQEFGFQISQDQINQQQQEKSPLPRLLADKYIKNEINRKFSSSHASEHGEGNFKAVLNQVYVVPYKINEQVQPYAFSLPVEGQPPQSGTKSERRGKSTSLNLNHSRQTENNEEDKERQHCLYYSNHNPVEKNHNHLDKHRPQPILTTHITPLQSDYRQSRPTPKSEPKEHHLSNEKTARSNSIGCKSKPIITATKLEQNNTQQSGEKLDHSRVTRLYKQQENHRTIHNPIQNQESSVIYDENEVNLCCGFSHPEKPSVNKITFTNKSGGLFCDEPPKQSGIVGPIRINSYKISPLSVIKGKESKEARESESQKKGIRLVGFNPSFQRKE